jgi:hypothetical protein
MYVPGTYDKNLEIIQLICGIWKKSSCCSCLDFNFNNSTGGKFEIKNNNLGMACIIGMGIKDAQQ